MPKDTQDACKSLCNEILLTIVRLADEDMLRESGNPVYLRMRRELDENQWVSFSCGIRRDSETQLH